MIVMNDGGNVDILDYVAKQFPKDLKQMLEVRAELAARQGAMTAVKAAEKDREKAAEELARAKDQAAKIDARQQALTAAETALKADQDALEKRRAEFNANVAQAEKDFAVRYANLEARERDVVNRELALKDAYAQHEIDRAALENRVKAFQDKVAALNV